MDEQAPMSDDETSDSEVIFVDNSPPPSTDTRQKKTQSKVVTEEMRMDEQLKELGLFEEGMSIEQKQELMVVLAASRETHEHEESMRQQAIEWERQLYSDVDDVPSYDTTPNEDSDHWKSDGIKTPVMYGQNSATMTDASRGAKNQFGNKAEETYSQKVKFTEKAFQMLDVDEVSKTSENQDQKPINTSLISADQFYSHSSDMSFPLLGSSQRRQLENSQKGKHHLTRSAYRPLSPSSSKVAVAHPMIRDSGGEMVVRDEDCSSISPIDFQRIKFKLDKSLASWKPCTSPVAPELDCKRASPTFRMDEYVPFFCPEDCNPKEYAKVILNSFKNYHCILRKVQEKSRIHIEWGEPVRVGRHHSDSLDALTPRHQVKVRNSDRMPTRSSNRSNVEVSYAEMESKECNDDSTMMNIEDYPEPISSDSNSIVRTSKSAFRPIKTVSLSVEKDRDPLLVSDNDLDDVEHNISDTLPRSKSCPSPVASNSDASARVDENSGRTLLSHLNSNKPLEEPGGNDSSSALRQWSPFAPSNIMLLNSEASGFDTFCTFAANKTTPSFESVVSEANETVSEKYEALETESLFDTQFHVRKDGQKTYSSRSHFKADKGLTVVSRAAGPSSNSQGASSAESSLNAAECNTPSQKGKCQSISKHDDVPLSQIEEGGISRKRKCELRLTRLTPSEIKAACPSKRWKKQS